MMSRVGDVRSGRSAMFQLSQPEGCDYSLTEMLRNLASAGWRKRRGHARAFQASLGSIRTSFVSL